MSAFWNNFEHGFFHGMFNNTFGGMFGAFGSIMPFSPFVSYNSCNPFMYSYPSTMFLTPNYNSLDFYQYQDTRFNLYDSVFNYNMPTYTDMSFTNTTFTMDDYSYQNLNKSTTLTYDWGDTFESEVNTTKKTKNKEKSKKEKRKEVAPEGKTEVKIVAETSNYSYNATELKKKWDKKKPGLSLEFFEKVVKISKEVKCSPEDLMAVMHSESAGTFNPGEWNHAGNRAVGLIQFTDIAVKSLDPSGKLTLEDLAKMSAIEQLDYVKKYLQYAKCNVAKFDKSHTLTAGDLYSIVYLPAVAKNEVLAKKESDPKGYYSKNKIFDSNGDGKITKSEMAGHVIAHRA